LVTPLVTDFTRRTQVMARYRMNDLLRLSAEPCACGSPFQAVAAVEGRQDDVFHLPGVDGVSRRMITPDVVRNAVVDADRRILDYRVVQTAADTLDLQVAIDLPEDAAQAARLALASALWRAGVGPVGIGLTRGIRIPLDRKLRRVRREWTP
jgi:phenylacetate-coenzyme A ligase PaaK-like adenylate-forming protein